jgi:hypothetical protein
MKKLILSVVGALAVAYPATAGAATFKGTVVERLASRHVLVVAARSGAAWSVHTTSAARVGAVVTVSATARRDGTFSASRVAVTGRANRARVHGVVLQSVAGLTFLSAGRSVVLVHTGGRALASVGDHGAKPGAVANVGVSIGANGTLSATSITTTGQANTVVIQATVTSITPATATTAGSLTLSVNGQTLTVPLAPGTTVPATLVSGSTVSLTISFGSGGATGTAASDDDNDENDQGDDNGDSGSGSSGSGSD